MSEIDRIEGIFRGTVQPLADDRDSAIGKEAVTDHVQVTRLGLEGDQHADTTNHGGEDRALLQYCSRHYTAWKTELPQATARFVPAAFGENISAPRLNEESVCIGDIYRMGDVLMQVSQPRSPCWKLNRRFGIDNMAERVQDSQRCGWLYRVLQPGHIGVGDSIMLEQRPCTELTVAAVMRALYSTPHTQLDNTFLQRIAATAELSANWRAKAERRLRGEQDNSRPRLYGDS